MCSISRVPSSQHLTLSAAAQVEKQNVKMVSSPCVVPAVGWVPWGKVPYHKEHMPHEGMGPFICPQANSGPGQLLPPHLPIYLYSYHSWHNSQAESRDLLSFNHWSDFSRVPTLLHACFPISPLTMYVSSPIYCEPCPEPISSVLASRYGHHPSLLLIPFLECTFQNNFFVF